MSQVKWSVPEPAKSASQIASVIPEYKGIRSVLSLDSEFEIPTKKIKTEADLTHWFKSKAFALLMEFIQGRGWNFII